MIAPPTVFISYSDDDQAWKQRLATQLQVAERLGRLEVWDRGCVAPGDNRRSAVADAIKRARVAVLLVSARFLASDSIAQEETRLIFERHQRESLRVLPVIIGPCLWPTTWLAELEVRPSDGKPLSGKPEAKAEEDLAALGKEILDLVTDTRDRSMATARTVRRPVASLATLVVVGVIAVAAAALSLRLVSTPPAQVSSRQSVGPTVSVPMSRESRTQPGPAAPSSSKSASDMAPGLGEATPRAPEAKGPPPVTSVPRVVAGNLETSPPPGPSPAREAGPTATAVLSDPPPTSARPATPSPSPPRLTVKFTVPRGDYRIDVNGRDIRNLTGSCPQSACTLLWANDGSLTPVSIFIHRSSEGSRSMTAKVKDDLAIDFTAVPVRQDR